MSKPRVRTVREALDELLAETLRNVGLPNNVSLTIGRIFVFRSWNKRAFLRKAASVSDQIPMDSPLPEDSMYRTPSELGEPIVLAGTVTGLQLDGCWIELAPSLTRIGRWSVLGITVLGLPRAFVLLKNDVSDEIAKIDGELELL